MRGVFKVAKVAISRASYGFDNEYSYSVPEHLRKDVDVGIRVVVPFGKGNKKASRLLNNEPKLCLEKR